MRNITWLLAIILSAGLCSLALADCPAGYAPITSADGRACVEIQARPHVRSFEAAPLCEESGARVCSATEIEAACASGQTKESGLAWEWSLSLGQYLSASANGSCEALAYGELTERAALRCCRSQ